MKLKKIVYSPRIIRWNVRDFVRKCSVVICNKGI